MKLTVGKKVILRVFLCFGAVFCFVLHSVYAQKPDNPLIWEKEIHAFEESDKVDMPKPGIILFVGSSSIRGWRSLEEDFPDYEVLNRGFGGSRIGDATYYFDRIIGKYQPKQVIFYSGDNDVASGKSPEMVFEQFREFAKTMKEKLPKTELVFLSIKPSLSRWKMYPDMQEANRMIKRYAFWHRNLKFVDVATPMLGDDGKPKQEIFLGDGLHMKPEGYAIWTSVVKPYLKK